MVKCLFQLDEPNHYIGRMGVSPFPSISKLLVSAFRCRCLAWISSQVREDDLGSTRRDYTQSHGGVVFTWFSGWWFQICFIFTPILGKWSNLTSIFFRWVETTNQFLSFNWMTLAVFQPWIFRGYHSISLRSETLLPAILRGEGDRQVNLAVGKIPPNPQLRHRSFRYHDTQVK